MTVRFARYFQFSLALACLVVLFVTILTDSRWLQSSSRFKFKTPSLNDLKPSEMNDINRCYYKSSDSNDTFRYFDDILDAETQPTPGKAIFFHETTCSRTGVVNLNAK